MEAEDVRSLLAEVELKDQSTAAHTWRVALYMMALADSFGADPDTVRRCVRGAGLHDVGKVFIPTGILAKPGKLTDDEFEVIKTHTTLGHDRLRAMGETDEIVLDLVRSHHERIDGSGYPDGLSGEGVPVVARYFAVIDAFDAMTSIRPYRREVGKSAADFALRELSEKSGPWYFPPAVERFAALYESGRFDWILRHFNDPKDSTGLAHLPEHGDLADAHQQAASLLRRAADSAANGY